MRGAPTLTNNNTTKLGEQIGMFTLQLSSVLYSILTHMLGLLILTKRNQLVIFYIYMPGTGILNTNLLAMRDKIQYFMY